MVLEDLEIGSLIAHYGDINALLRIKFIALLYLRLPIAWCEVLLLDGKHHAAACLRLLDNLRLIMTLFVLLALFRYLHDLGS